jgi:methionyl aminopeptidase
MEKSEIEKIKKAGEIHREVMKYARGIVKRGVKLIEIAEKIDAKILELGGKPAFPVNLSVDFEAAHCTPAWNSDEVARGLLKVDVGIHVDGFVADSAFSIDLEDSEENRRIIEAAEAGLRAGLEKFGKGVPLNEVGAAIDLAVSKKGFVAIRNLTGHLIEQYNLHAGMNVPNYDNGQTTEVLKGLYAVEPFATNGHGRVKDGKPSGIYSVNIMEGNVRDNFAREVLAFIDEEYLGLPFCSRWIYRRFGSRGLLALRQIEQAGILHQYAQLIEENRGKVAQAEHTVLILGNGERIVTTRGD